VKPPKGPSYSNRNREKFGSQMATTTSGVPGPGTHRRLETSQTRKANAPAYSLKARHAPHTIIDLATLTGACVVALGEYAAGLFGNSSALRGALVAAGEARGERLWPMPIFAEHREEIRAAATADLQSTGGGRMGGACTAAAFLEFFIGAQAAGAGGGGAAPAAPAAMPAWAHLDIAGPGMYSKPRGFMNAGGTGFGVLFRGPLLGDVVGHAGLGRFLKRRLFLFGLVTACHFDSARNHLGKRL
jgi:hypothetical protein